MSDENIKATVKTSLKFNFFVYLFISGVSMIYLYINTMFDFSSIIITVIYVYITVGLYKSKDNNNNNFISFETETIKKEIE